MAGFVSQSSALGILSPMDEVALDRLIATVESLHALYEQAKDGDPAALEQLLAQTQAALDQIEQLRSR